MDYGVFLPNGCQLTHGQGANVKKPFADIPLEMHELAPGGNSRLYTGQFGIIRFDASLRLPRHVHISTAPGPQDNHGGASNAAATAPLITSTGNTPATSKSKSKRSLVTERILVLNGVAMVELSGTIYVVAPHTLVTIAPGVPHTWTACPAGVRLPDGLVSRGEFLMVYEYEEVTGFFPTSQTETLRSVDEYVAHEGGLEDIRFPALTREDVVRDVSVVWNREITKLSLS
jgi:hypothetical protein